MGQVVRALVQWAGVSLPVSLTSYSVVRSACPLPSAWFRYINSPVCGSNTTCSSAPGGHHASPTGCLGEDHLKAHGISR